MLPSTGPVSGMARTGGRFLAAAALAGLLLAGCKDVNNLRGEGFKPDPGIEVGQYRPGDRDSEFDGFSNKARQIERNVGVR